MTDVGSVAVAGLTSSLDALTEQVRHTIADMIAGSGGVFLLALGILGAGVLVYDAISMLLRMGRRRRRRRAAFAQVTRAERARSLAANGASTSEISRETGLPRDALRLLDETAAEPGFPETPQPAAVPGVPQRAERGLRTPRSHPLALPDYPGVTRHPYRPVGHSSNGRRGRGAPEAA